MDENPQPEAQKEADLASEFRELGNNIVQALKAAWESPERKKLQNELETGLTELADTINTEVKSFAESPSGQRLKSDAEDIKERIRSGEAEAQLRQELLNALKIANAELQKATQIFRKSDPGEEATSAGAEENSG